MPQLVGANDRVVVDKVTKFFENVGVQTVNLRIAEAEHAKLFSNVYRDLHFGISNLFSEICADKNIDYDSVRYACSHQYPRAQIPLAGLVAGPCLIKDAKLLASSIKDPKYQSFVLTGREIYSRQIGKKVEYIREILKTENVILTGIAFKGSPETDDYRDSPALDILQALANDSNSNRLYIHDFVIGSDLLKKLPCWQEYDGARIERIMQLNNHKNNTFGANPFKAGYLLSENVKSRKSLE